LKDRLFKAWTCFCYFYRISCIIMVLYYKDVYFSPQVKVSMSLIINCRPIRTKYIKSKVINHFKYL